MNGSKPKSKQSAIKRLDVELLKKLRNSKPLKMKKQGERQKRRKLLASVPWTSKHPTTGHSSRGKKQLPRKLLNKKRQGGSTRLNRNVFKKRKGRMKKIQGRQSKKESKRRRQQEKLKLPCSTCCNHTVTLSTRAVDLLDLAIQQDMIQLKAKNLHLSLRIDKNILLVNQKKKKMPEPIVPQTLRIGQLDFVGNQYRRGLHIRH